MPDACVALARQHGACVGTFAKIGTDAAKFTLCQPFQGGLPTEQSPVARAAENPLNSHPPNIWCSRSEAILVRAPSTNPAFAQSTHTLRLTRHPLRVAGSLL